MTKIDIISGFLGAGKTTFIKKMLQEAFKGEQVVLIENIVTDLGTGVDIVQAVVTTQLRPQLIDSIANLFHGLTSVSHPAPSPTEGKT